MPSMTPMMSTILCDEVLISFMVSTTWATTAPPRAATAEAASAMSLAVRAWSAFWLTVLLSSSVAEAVSSSELACCSVRCERSSVPAATWLEALAIESAPEMTCEIN